MTVQWNDDRPEQTFDYVIPDAADDDSSLPLVLDEAPIDKTPPVTETPVSTDKGLSIADRLRQDFGNRAVPTIEIPVPQRDGWKLRFRLDWSESKVEKWKKQAKDRSIEDGVSKEKFSLAMIADQCTHIILDDSPIVIGGERWTFQSKAFQQEMGVNTPTQAVKRMFPVYTELLIFADQVTAAAGQGDALDPM